MAFLSRFSWWTSGGFFSDDSPPADVDQVGRDASLLRTIMDCTSSLNHDLNMGKGNEFCMEYT